jgi:hypothetical protein
MILKTSSRSEKTFAEFQDDALYDPDKACSALMLGFTWL